MLFDKVKSTLYHLLVHKIGLGLLTALYEGSAIVFGSHPSPALPIRGRSDHLVVCEEGKTFRGNCGELCVFARRWNVFDTTGRSQRSRGNDGAFYRLYESREVSPTDTLRDLSEDPNRVRCSSSESIGSLTFITGGTPYGFAFPQFPSTHLPKYPDLGIAVINGLAAGQANGPGMDVAVLVDPATTEAPEVEEAATILSDRKLFVRGYFGPNATVRKVQQAIELFPYDLLLIATHCSDASGYQWPSSTATRKEYIGRLSSM